MAVGKLILELECSHHSGADFRLWAGVDTDLTLMIEPQTTDEIGPKIGIESVWKIVRRVHCIAAAKSLFRWKL